MPDPLSATPIGKHKSHSRGSCYHYNLILSHRGSSDMPYQDGIGRSDFDTIWDNTIIRLENLVTGQNRKKSVRPRQSSIKLGKWRRWWGPQSTFWAHPFYKPCTLPLLRIWRKPSPWWGRPSTYGTRPFCKPCSGTGVWYPRLTNGTLGQPENPKARNLPPQTFQPCVPAQDELEVDHLSDKKGIQFSHFRQRETSRYKQATIRKYL